MRKCFEQAKAVFKSPTEVELSYKAKKAAARRATAQTVKEPLLSHGKIEVLFLHDVVFAYSQ